MIARVQTAVAPSRSAERWVWTGAELEARAEHIFNRYSAGVVAAVCGLCFVLTCLLAADKIIWTDEFFTLYLSRLGNWNDLNQALLTGGDQHPIWFYLTHHVFLRVFGENPVALRLPQLLGFVVMSVCVYRFVAKHTSPAYGVMAMVMPLLTVAHSYSYEARGYGLVVGYFSVAVLCWQRSGDAERRLLPLAGLAAGLSGTVASHYYAALLIPAVALAEVVRSVRRRRIAWDVWLAISAPAFVIAAAFPVLAAANKFAGSFWAPASWTGINTFYVTMFFSGISGLGAGLVAASLCVLLLRPHPSASAMATIPPEEIVLALAVGAAPVAGVLFGKAVTGVFAWRYAVGAVVGLSILFGFIAFAVFRGRAICAAVFIAIATVAFSVQSVNRIDRLRAEREGIEELARQLPASSADSPLVVAQSDMFYKLTFYTPPELKRHYVYLTDTERSRKYLRQDTPDRSLAALSPWFQLPVQPYDVHVAAHPTMTVLTDLDPNWTWLPSALVENGSTAVQVVSRSGANLLLSVRRNSSRD